MAIFEKLGNYRNFGLLVMRLGLGAMMMYHGYPKITGGPEAWTKVGSAIGDAGIHFAPMFWGLMAALSEAGGGLLVLLGLWFRPACIFIMITMIVASIHVLAKGGAIGDAAQSIELGFVFLGLLFIGPGKYAVDKK